MSYDHSRKELWEVWGFVRLFGAGDGVRGRVFLFAPNNNDPGSLCFF